MNSRFAHAICENQAPSFCKAGGAKDRRIAKYDGHQRKLAYAPRREHLGEVLSVIIFSFFDRIRRLAASLSTLVAAEATEYEVIVQQWDQFEPDWGRTHGGYSLHLTEADRLRFVAKSEDEDRSRSTYFVPDSIPVVRLVDKATHKKVTAGKNGIWWPDDSLPSNWNKK